MYPLIGIAVLIQVIFNIWYWIRMNDLEQRIDFVENISYKTIMPKE